MNAIERLGWKVEHNKDPGALPIDISIFGAEGEVAHIWGENDVADWGCMHPEEDVDFGDDDERGECTLCGSTCDWRWIKEVVDEGYDGDDGHHATVGETRLIGEWHRPEQISGVLGEYIEELRGKKDGQAL